MMHPHSARAITGYQAVYGPFPDDYFAIDVETTGLDRHNDYVLQIGIVTVERRKAVLSRSLIINWPRYLDADRVGDFSGRLARTKVAMESRGKQYPWTTTLLDERGELPDAVAAAVREILGDNPYCVGHYAWGFDYPMLSRFLMRHSSEFSAYSHRLYDTCLLSRASLANAVAVPGEDPTSYYRRLNDIRGFPGCKLEDCILRYQLENAGVQPGAAHVSEYDAWVAHLIFEKHRTIGLGT